MNNNPNDNSYPITRDGVRDSLKSQIEKLKGSTQDDKEIAYQIAGLLNTDFARSLPDDDIYLKIMLMAGELELPDGLIDKENSNWKKLVNMVDSI